MSTVSYFTKDGLEKLKAELTEKKTKGRSAMARAIQEARDKGDLSENAEYDAAKEAQGLLEMEIAKLETLIANAKILDETRIDTSKVTVHTKVSLKNLSNQSMVKYHLVSEKEADFKAGKISIGSPIGKGLLGSKVGDTVEISVPSGTMKFEVIEITA